MEGLPLLEVLVEEIASLAAAALVEGFGKRFALDFCDFDFLVNHLNNFAFVHLPEERSFLGFQHFVLRFKTRESSILGFELVGKLLNLRVKLNIPLGKHLHLIKMPGEFLLCWLHLSRGNDHVQKHLAIGNFKFTKFLRRHLLKLALQITQVDFGQGKSLRDILSAGGLRVMHWPSYYSLRDWRTGGEVIMDHLYQGSNRRIWVPGNSLLHPYTGSFGHPL